jgi:hypothetical protein
MSRTALAPTEEASSTGGRRWLKAAVPVVVVAAGIGAWATLHDRGSAPVLFSPATHQVAYEMVGKGTVDSLSYAGDPKGPDNGNVTLRKVTLPWRMSVAIPVGLGGGVASLASNNPANSESTGSVPKTPGDAAPLVCRISVDGKLVAQRTSEDGFTDAACSAILAPKRS